MARALFPIRRPVSALAVHIANATPQHPIPPFPWGRAFVLCAALLLAIGTVGSLIAQAIAEHVR